MDPCLLPATGIDGGAFALAGTVALAVGAATVLAARRSDRRRRERTASSALSRSLVALPLIAVTLAATLAAATPAPGAHAAVCPPALVPPAVAPPVGPPIAPPDGVEYTAGASGIGDPYYPLDGNGGYDVQHYDLDLAYDPATDTLAGTAAVTLTATQNLSSFNLDFDTRDAAGADKIVIGGVSIEGREAAHSLATTQISKATAQPLGPDEGRGVNPPRTELTVTPAVGIPAGTTLEVTIAYAGVPIRVDDSFGAAGVFHTKDGMVVVGEPRVAATWFPANDHPSDKATMTMSMTAPTGLTVLGNGVPEAPIVDGEQTTWTYVMDSPMATYLATATVGRYDVATTTVDGVTYRDAVAESLFSRGSTGADSRAAFALNPVATAFLEGIYGPYPFTESGGIAVDVPDLGFALENQTRPIYSGRPGEGTIVHELAHQWVGNSVALSRWSDIWLNEGFATYSEWLWIEAKGGETAQQQFEKLFSQSADASFWTGEVADPGPANIFGPAYQRGAMTLQALRTQVGEEDFFAILKSWAEENADGNVTTEQFERHAAEVSGEDLSELFDTWLHTAGKPDLT